MLKDVSRAYFNAPATCGLSIEWPKGDKVMGEEDMVGKMRLCLYGTHDPAFNWQKDLSDHLITIGFQRGTAFLCVFWHPVRKVTTLVHGDDYAFSGYDKNLRWFDSRLKQRFEIKTTVIGSEDCDAKEAKILKRIMRITEPGLELEGDPRHAELIMEELGLTASKGIAIPGDNNPDFARDEQLDELHSQSIGSLAARANYLSAESPDLQFCVKELCRGMSSPTQAS